MFLMCSHWFLLQRIFAGASTLSVGTFRAGLAGLGTSYSSAATYGTRFDDTRHFGASELRDYTYVDKCSCFEFVSTTLHPAR
jgi:hypothetical protein